MDRKRANAKDEISVVCGCNVGCSKCAPKRSFIDLLCDSNMPEAYWAMSYKNFSGAQNIRETTEKYIVGIKENYNKGLSMCYCGTPGSGKTMSLCTILKATLASGYSAYYTTLADLVFYITDHTYKSSYYQQLISADFLCLDEMDPRYFDTEQSENFFGRNLERVFRYRVQNRLPMLFATNQKSLEDVFSGQFKKIFESVAAQSVVNIPALGPDYRIKNKLK